MSSRGRAAGAAGTAIAVLAALVPAAQGRTIGSAEKPAGASGQFCPSVGDGRTFLLQGSGASPSWTVPHDGVLTSWSIYRFGFTDAAELIVTRSGVHEPTTIEIVALDRGTVAAQPGDSIVTLTPERPIAVRAGDRLGVAGDSNWACSWQGGAVPSDQSVMGASALTLRRPGAPLSLPTSNGGPGTQLNLAAEIVDTLDMRVAAAPATASAVAGQLTQLAATVVNGGTVTGPAGVTVAVPAGLKVEGAYVGGGSCTVAAQQVSCAVPALGAGASAPVVVLVTPLVATLYVTQFDASAPFLEAAPSDNSSVSSLQVAAAPSAAGAGGGGGGGAAAPAPVAVTPRCVVPSLAGTPQRVARSLLTQLRCKPGKVTKADSKRIAKGAVIATRPGRGEYVAGSAVALVVSSGMSVRRAARSTARRGRGR